MRTPERYIERIAEGRPAEAASEELDGDRQRIEGLQLALRTNQGVPVHSLSSDDLELLGPLVTVENESVVLTAEGRLLANEVAVRLR